MKKLDLLFIQIYSILEKTVFTLCSEKHEKSREIFALIGSSFVYIVYNNCFFTKKADAISDISCC